MRVRVFEAIRRPLSWLVRAVLVATGMLQVMSGCALIADKSMYPKDLEECDALSSALLDRYQLAMAATKWGRGGRAVYCGIHQRQPFIPHLYTEIRLYEIIDRIQQDATIETLRAARMRGYKPIIVEFFEKENWTDYLCDGGRVCGGGRGKEVLLRTEIIR